MTPGEVVILGLIYEKDCYGYEIENLVKQRGIREWTEIGFSSIYNMLNKLEKSGYISSRYDKQYGSPKRKVYFINENAKADFLNQVKSMLMSPKMVFSEFDIGMAYSHLLNKEEFENCIAEYIRTIKERMDRIQEKYKAESEDAEKFYYVKALFTRPLHLLKAEIEWVEKQLSEM